VAENAVSLAVEVEVKDALKRLETFEKEAKASTSGVEKAFSALKGVAAAAIAVFAGKQVVDFFAAGVDAAVAQESALASLGQQLKLTGEFSDGALESFAAFADQMEATTTNGDDVILSQLAVAKSFGVTNEQAQKLVEAAVELSAATGKDLQSSVQALGATFSGTAGKLEKTVPALTGLSKEALASGAALDVVLERFGGSAIAQLDTFAGATTQAENAFGNLQEAFGAIIVKNPALIAAIKGARTILAELQRIVEENQQAIGEFISGGIKVLVVTLGAAVDATRGFVKALKFMAVGTVLALSTMVDVAGGFADAFSALLPEGTVQKINDFRDAITDTAVAVDDKFSTFEDGFARFQQAVDSASQSVFDADSKVTASAKDAAQAREAFSRVPVIDAEALKKQADEAKKLSKEITESTLTDIQKIVAKRDEYYLRIDALEKAGALSAVRATELRVAAEESAITKLVDLREKADADAQEAQAKAAKESADRARAEIEHVASKPFEFAAQVVMDFDEVDQKKATALGVGILSRMLDGAAGAKSAIAELGGGIADAFLPGIGGAVAGVLGKLAEGPEATEQFIRDFIAAVPDIIVAIAESIPVVVEALVDSLILDGGIIRIAEALLRAITLAPIFENIGKQLGIQMGDAFNADKIGHTLSQGAQDVANSITEGINAFFNYFQYDFIGDLRDGVSSAFNKILDFFRGFHFPSIDTPEWMSGFANAIASLTTIPSWLEPFVNAIEKLTSWNPASINDIGGSGQGLVPDKVPVLGGLATGITSIPRGFPNDSYLTGLTSGERVVDAGTNEDLKSFLASGGLGGGVAELLTRLIAAVEGKQQTVELRIDSSVLGKAILGLNTRNARLAR